MSTSAPIQIRNVNHYFGGGATRKQILFDITAEIHAGEIVILAGPSGSGKTTLLTLIGALRSVQEGSLHVLGQELCDAAEATLVRVRRQVGYIFQAHNLLDSLNAKENVATPVNWKPGEEVIIPTSVSDEEAMKKYPQGFKTQKPYLRTVSLGR